VARAVSPTTRDEVLGRVRAALRSVPRDERPEDVAVERRYRRGHDLSRVELVELFCERVADYRATVRRVGSGAAIAAAVGQACAERGADRLVGPADLPPGWAPDGVELVPDHGVSHHDLDQMDGVLSGCALGIAETGTIALDGGARQGRRAISLLPDLHVCVVEEDQIVGGVPEAMARLEAAVRDEGRPVTFISGPSATSDIELDRVEGVHGPRDLVVLVAGLHGEQPSG